jgi:signal transduction histidine kinase
MAQRHIRQLDEVAMTVCTTAALSMGPATVDLLSRCMPAQVGALPSPATMTAAPASTGELATMCHEIKNPLNAVLGFTQLLGTDDALGDKHRRHLQAIEEAARHILAIVEETLAAARQHAKTKLAGDQAVTLGPVIEDVVRWMEPAAMQAGVELCAPATDAVVRGDAQHLHEVLLNLVSNAVKYNVRGGKVSVSTRVDRANGRVRIDVRDTGPGMSPEAQARLFQPFERLGAEHTDVQGTGIGLYITRQLVQGMGGAMDVHSEPGEGSVFSVSLRRAVPAACKEVQP